MFQRKLRLVVLGGCAAVLVFVLAHASGGLFSSVEDVPSSVERPVDPVNLLHIAATPTEVGGSDSESTSQEVWSAEGVESGAILATPMPQPSVVPSPTPNSDPPPEDDQVHENGDADDARHIFSPLVQPGNSLSNDGFFNGIRVSGAGALGPEAEATKAASEGLPWVEGQARGYTMLYAMQPDAREVVERNVQAMLTSHVKDLYIGVLIDGTFGQDFEYLRSLITRLSAQDRRLTVALYLSNGATMRKWDTTPITALFARIKPEEFRSRILREQGLQNQFRDVARQARRIFVFNTGSFAMNSNVALVMLEDNLDQSSYRVMRDLASSEIGNTAQFIRNPCVGCLRGNDDDSLGDPREEHTLERYGILRAGDAFSLDGTGFAYPGMPPGKEVSSTRLMALMLDSFSRALRYVGLWREEWQGVEYGKPNPHPELRAYTPSSDDQIGFEIEVLRHGLNPVDSLP